MTKLRDFVQISAALFLLEAFVIVLLYFAGGTAVDRTGGVREKLGLFIALPAISGIIGYATNKLALIMTFAPLDFVGVPLLLIPDEPVGLFGWQGIIPAKAGKMAGISVDLMLEKLFNVQEIFERLDPAHVARLLQPGLHSLSATILDTVGQEQVPDAWAALPKPAREQLVQSTAKHAPTMIIGMLGEMKERILDVLDVRAMTIRHLELRKDIMIDMFKSCGVDEFIFIERSGWYFGFLFGLIQMIIYAFYDAVWVLPAFGFVVGYATNAIALKMIFEPIEPVDYRLPCGFTYTLQGLFLKRQREVSVIFAQKAAGEIMTSKLMWDEMLRGPNAHRFEAIVRKHVGKLVDRTAGSDAAGNNAAADAFLRARPGSWHFASVKDRIADLVIEMLPAQVELIHGYTDEALDLEREMREKMQALPPREFEGVLHPVFEEDEIKLILVGAALGCAVGCLQEFVLFVHL